MTAVEKRGRRKVRVGHVVSDKMDKTAVVAVTRLVRHPMYKRFVKRTTRFKAHDEKNECHVGDIVRITETRPLSKDKRWRVVEVVRRAQ
jgi:small subunit ribosomal protein S17